MQVQKARVGHGGHPEHELEDGTRYELQTESHWWGIQCKNMHLDRYLGLLDFMRIQMIRCELTFIKISGLSVAFKEEEHRFDVYVYVSRGVTVSPGETFPITEEDRIELSMVLGIELPHN